MPTRSAEIRARLDHPVIDSDGHTVEFLPAVQDYLRQVGGPNLLERSRRHRGSDASSVGWWYKHSSEERFAQRAARPPWWALPARNTLDRATSSLPRLLRERLDDNGLDFTVLYPTLGLLQIGNPDDEMRPAMCRASSASRSSRPG